MRDCIFLLTDTPDTLTLEREPKLKQVSVNWQRDSDTCHRPGELSENSQSSVKRGVSELSVS